MNIRAEIPARDALAATVIPLTPGRPRPLAEGFIARVADQAAALFFDEPSPPARLHRLAVDADGASLPGPLVSTTLPLRTGGVRHVVLVGQRCEWLASRRLKLSLAGRTAAILDPDWLQSPLVDLAALFEGLSGEGRQRLLRLFLTTGASLLGRGAPEFARTARSLLALLGVRRLEPLGWTPAGTAARLVSYRLPPGLDPARLGPLVTVTAATMARAADTPLALEHRPGGTLLHLRLAAPAGDTLLVATGAEPLALALPAGTPPVAIERWLAARDPATRSWCGTLLDSAAATDPLARALARELCHRDAPPPTLAVGHLSGTPAGIVHAFRLSDPHGLVRAIRIARGGATATLAVEAGATLAGYHPLPRVSSIDDRCRLSLVLRSGRTLPVAEGPLPAFDGDPPPGLSPAAVAAARLDRERAGRVLRTESFGAPGEPMLSLVCPLSICPDLVAIRAALVAAEPGGHAVEILYHAAEGPEADAARALLADAAATFDLAHRLVVVTPDVDPAARIVAAVAAAKAPRLLLLGAEVLPAEPGWLAPWRRLSHRHPMLRAGVEGYDGRREAEAGDCPGFLREAVVAVLGSAVPCDAPAVLVAQAAAVFARAGTPEARLGLVFRRYGDGSLTAFEKAAAEAALALILERSFTIACDEERP